MDATEVSPRPRARSRCAARSAAWILFALAFGGQALAQSTGAAQVPPIHVYEVMSDGKPQSVLSLLPVERVFKSGLPGAAIAGSLKVSPTAGGEVEADNVVVNPAFVELLQDFIARTAPTDPAFARAAREQGDGWLYVIDRRTPTPMGHVPNEDILGGFELRAGEALAGSYQPNRGFRVVGRNGVLQLDPFLHPRLLQALRELPPPAPTNP